MDANVAGMGDSSHDVGVNGQAWGNVQMNTPIEYRKDCPKDMFYIVNPEYMNIHPCCCIGEQNGEPYCPCKMKNLKVFKRDGRWIQPELDLGSC